MLLFLSYISLLLLLRNIRSLRTAASRPFLKGTNNFLNMGVEIRILHSSGGDASDESE